MLDLALKQKDGGCMSLEESKDTFRCTVNDFKPSVCKSYPFQMKNGKLIQTCDVPVEWDTKVFGVIMSNHLKKDEDEWNFYDELVLEWNVKHGIKKPLSKFLKFMLDRAVLEFVKS